jgi:hypothetical protein
MPFVIGEVEVTNEVSLAPSAVLYDGAVTADGDLTVKVNAFYYDIGGTHGKYAGTTGQSVTDDATNYVYLSSGFALVINSTGYPVGDHIRLARVVAQSGFIVRVILERSFFTAGSSSGMVPGSRRVDTSNGLQGGGDLTADLTLEPTYGSTANTVCEGDDARLSNARTPTAHASTHAAGGSDYTTPKEYGPLSADPSSPAPANGDRYFNTVLREDMVYDNARAKWLSVSDFTILSGASGDTSAGSYYRGMDGMSYSSTRGHPVPKGTLVGIGICKTDSNTTPLEVLVDTTVIATLTVTAAGVTVDWTVNADFSQGQMKFRNKSSGGATATNVQITAIIKRRA